MGRCECLQDLYIAGKFKPKKIKCCPTAKQESEFLKQRAQERLKLENFFEESSITIGFINIRSLKKHWLDFQTDQHFQKCDLIGLGETWLEPENQSPNLSGYETTSVNVRRGQGVTTFSKQLNVVLKIGKDLYSIIALHSKEWIFVFMYVSQHAPQDEIVSVLSNLSHQRDESILILGDMNWDYLTQLHQMKEFLISNGFSQRVQNATHEHGGLLDQAYVKIKNDKFTVETFQKAKYYSDHDALFIKIKE